MKGMVKFNIRRPLAVLSAAVMMTACAAALPASAETETETEGISSRTEDGCPGAGLSQPKIIKVSKTSDSVTLKWNMVKNASGYKVFRKIDGKYKAVGTVKGGKNIRFKVKKLNPGGKYTFKVRAYRKYNGNTCWSKYSKAKTVTTVADYSGYQKYIDKFTEKCRNKNHYHHGYKLVDMDGDGSKELIISYGAKKDRTCFEIYSYKNGKPKWTSQYQGYNNKLYVNDGSVYILHGFVEGSYAIIIDKFVYTEDGYFEPFFVDQSEDTKEDYDRVMKKYCQHPIKYKDLYDGFSY